MSSAGVELLIHLSLPPEYGDYKNVPETPASDCLVFHNGLIAQADLELAGWPRMTSNSGSSLRAGNVLLGHRE